ncbi:MAG: hypothetical protein WAM78_03390 [Candidatus Sulfotelmatobacter sp.]
MHTRLLFLFAAAMTVTCCVSARATTYTGYIGVGGSDLTWYTTGSTGARTEHWDHGSFTLTVGSSSIEVGYSEASTPESIATALCSLMTSTYPIHCTGASNGFITVTGTENYTIACTQYSYYVGSSFSPCERAGFGVVQISLKELAPEYKVLSIIYDAPGNGSQNGYTQSSTDGTTTGISETFTNGTSTSYTESFGFAGFGAFSSSIGWSYGEASVTGSSSSSSFSVTSAEGVANKTASGAPNATNHQQDLFLIWLNPFVVLEQTGASSVAYSLSVPPQPGNSTLPQTQDVVQVFAASMLPNTNGNTSVPTSILEPQRLTDGEVLPGLAAICANQTYYPNECSDDPNGQCGCMPKDFQKILAADLILNLPGTTAPTSVNNSTNGNRFAEIMNGSTPLYELLAGPQQQGGNSNPNTFSVADANQTSYSSTQGTTTTTSYSAGFSFGSVSMMGWSLQATNTDTFTWNDTESFGGVYGQTHQAMVTLSSSTVGCSEDVAIFEDTVFHTFAFQQPTGNSSCP